MEQEYWKNLSLENLEGEIWKSIPNFEGFMASNLGRIKMLERKVLANKSIKTIKEHILKQYETHKKYLCVHLWDNNKKKQIGVHKLVLMSFEGIKDGKEANHKNEDRKDNRLVNLEWLSHKENLNYGNRTSKHSKSMRNHPSLSKPVHQFDIKGNFIAEYPSLREAARRLGIFMTGIKECCKGRASHSGGFIWKYKEN